jgi:hypothetical protein
MYTSRLRSHLQARSGGHRTLGLKSMARVLKPTSVAQVDAKHDVLAEVVRLASAAMGQCFSWGPQEHRSTYERIIAVAMRYSAVVNYAGAIEIPLLPRHPVSSSSSASTAASQPMPATFAGGFSAPRAQQHPQAQGPHTYMQWPFAPSGAGTISRTYFQLMHAIIVHL